MKRKSVEWNAKGGKQAQLKHKAPHSPRRKARLNPKATIHQGV
ncbi:MAG: hypothetical protein WAM91_14525 [Candidatus Acidiferrales bacterium]